MVAPSVSPIYAVNVEGLRRDGFALVHGVIPPRLLVRFDELLLEVQKMPTPDWVPQRNVVGSRSLAYDFAAVLRKGGEDMLGLLEQPSVLAMAAMALGTSEVVVESFAVGNTLTLEQPQLHWHSDNGAPVSLRTVLDRHDPAIGNARLRILPRSHTRSRTEVQAELELRESEIVSQVERSAQQGCFREHLEEVNLTLDPAETLVWTPACWHATEVQTGLGARRAICWNLGVRGRSRRSPRWQQRCHGRPAQSGRHRTAAVA